MSENSVTVVGRLKASFEAASAHNPNDAEKPVFELSDDMATRINVLFYSDTPDALLKALLE